MNNIETKPNLLYKYVFKEIPIEDIERYVSNPSGIIMVNGNAGSGKTATQNAFISYINNTREATIINVCNNGTTPKHNKKKSHITQVDAAKEYGSIANALTALENKNPNGEPDYLFIEDTTDLTTLEQAIKFAETGTLVFISTHAEKVEDSLSSIIDIAPQEGVQETIKSLTENIKVIVQNKNQSIQGIWEPNFNPET